MFLSVKDARTRLGVTQVEMATLLGITRNYLALMETNKRNTPPEILEKARELVGNTGEKQSVTEWKSRALSAEAKLGRLRAAIRNFNKVVENLEGAL